MDHTHDEFVSGKQACVDPPHLRMVFDEAVVNSLLTPDSHQALSAPAPASQDHHQAANHGADAVVKQDKGQQLQSDHAQEAFGTAAQGGAAQQNPARLSDSLAGQSQQASDSSLDSAQLNVEPGDWQAVLQCSMQAARDIKWTHKGLQVGLSVSDEFMTAVSVSAMLHHEQHHVHLLQGCIAAFCSTPSMDLHVLWSHTYNNTRLTVSAHCLVLDKPASFVHLLHNETHTYVQCMLQPHSTNAVADV